MVVRKSRKKPARRVTAWRGSKTPALKDVLDPFAGSLKALASRAVTRSKRAEERAKLAVQGAITNAQKIEALSRALEGERALRRLDRKSHEILADQVLAQARRIEELEQVLPGTGAVLGDLSGDVQEELRQHECKINEDADALMSLLVIVLDTLTPSQREQVRGRALRHAESYRDKYLNVTGSSKS